MSSRLFSGLGAVVARLSVPVAASLTLVGSSGCGTLLLGVHALYAVGADDMGPNRAEEIKQLSASMDDAIAADDLEKAMGISKALWDVSFATSCNQCTSVAFPTLYKLREVVLAAPTTRPAYEAASILKLASTNLYYAAGITADAEDELKQFREELKAAASTVEARAKPEITEKAASLEAAGKPASALAVMAQLSAIYPDDAEARARKTAMLEALKSANAFRVTATGSEAASSLARGTFTHEAIAFEAGAPVTVTVTLGEPTTDVQSAQETQSVRVVRGMKTVENNDYARLVKKIEHTEKLRSENTRATDIERRTDQINSLRKELGRMSPTEQVEDAVSESFPGTRTTRVVRRLVQVRVTRGVDVIGDVKDTVSASRSALSHGGHGPARAVSEPVPQVSDIDGDVVESAAKRARVEVIAAYRAHVAALVKAKAAEDPIEAAALAVALDPGAASQEDADAARKGLRISDPRVLLTAR